EGARRLRRAPQRDLQADRRGARRPARPEAARRLRPLALAHQRRDAAAAAAAELGLGAAVTGRARLVAAQPSRARVTGAPAGRPAAAARAEPRAREEAVRGRDAAEERG